MRPPSVLPLVVPPLNKEPIIEYLNSNIVLWKWMIAEGYGDRRTLERRIQGMEKWLANPELLEADADAGIRGSDRHRSGGY